MMFFNTDIGCEKEQCFLIQGKEKVFQQVVGLEVLRCMCEHVTEGECVSTFHQPVAQELVPRAGFMGVGSAPQLT